MQALLTALKLLGLATPFIYAGATFAIFHYLDKKASGQAKKAISSWLKPTGYDKAAVAKALVEIFDRIYTSPLLRPRALLRSGLISLGVFALAIYEAPIVRQFVEAFVWDLTHGYSGAWTFAISLFLPNILIDYLSLFVVRPWLVIGAKAPLLASIGGPITGALVVILLIIARDRISHESLISIDRHVAWDPDVPLFDYLNLFLREGIYSLDAPVSTYQAILYLALAVHLWLPFLALCVVVMRVLDFLLASAGRMQWFLKQGQQHPLDALGYVASALVFLGSALWQTLK